MRTPIRSVGRMQRGIRFHIGPVVRAAHGSMHPLVPLAILTVLIGVPSFLMTPREKRAVFVLHLAMVTGLTAYVVLGDGQ